MFYKFWSNVVVLLIFLLIRLELFSFFLLLLLMLDFVLLVCMEVLEFVFGCWVLLGVLGCCVFGMLILWVCCKGKLMGFLLLIVVVFGWGIWWEECVLFVLFNWFSECVIGFWYWWIIRYFMLVCSMSFVILGLWFWVLL